MKTVSYSPGVPPIYQNVKPANNWDWYFVMQHYGAPTRLLDWTEGALHGLYFALRNNYGYDDAAVWVLNPWKFNKKTVGMGTLEQRERISNATKSGSGIGF